MPASSTNVVDGSAASLLVTEKVENLALKAYVIPEELEGVVIEAYETISKVVHPDFMSWPLNKVLFEGDA